MKANPSPIRARRRLWPYVLGTAAVAALAIAFACYRFWTAPTPPRATDESSFLGKLLVKIVNVAGPRNFRAYELGRKSFDAKTLQRIQSDTGINLPAGARGLNFYYTPPVDPAYIAKIEIPPAFKEEVIKMLNVIKNDKNIHVEESWLGKKVSWWIPRGAKVLVDRQRRGGGAELHVMLTEEDTTVILYIEWVTF